jgi:hypothetical protein
MYVTRAAGPQINVNNGPVTLAVISRATVNITGAGGGGGSPTGVAGGDLTGSTYPSPVLKPAAVTSAKIAGKTVNAQVGTTYTIAPADAYAIVTLTNAAPVTVNIDTFANQAHLVGAETQITGMGAGLVTIAYLAGVTINNPAGASLILARYQVATLIHVSTNVWEVQKGARPPDGTTLAVNAAGQMAFAPTADVAVGGHKLTGVTPAAATGEVTTFEQTVIRSGGGLETVSTNAASGAAATLNLANGNIQDLTLTAACTLTFSGSVAAVACSFTLIARQDATGSRAITWPASVEWAGGVAPTISTVASRVDVFTFVTVDNGTTWLGFTGGIGVR